MRKVLKYENPSGPIGGALPQANSGTNVAAAVSNMNTNNYASWMSTANALAPYIFGNSTGGNIISGIAGGLLQGGLQQSLQNSLTNGLKSGATSAVGIGAGLLGQGIESWGNHSKFSKFAGGAVSSGLGQVGSAFVNNGMAGVGNIFGSAAGISSFGMGVVGAGLQAMNGPSKEYQGKYGSITKNMDLAYDAVQAGVNAIGPVGSVISGGMALNKGLSNLFGSTDGMTAQDAILGSAWMPAPVKWLNMAGAKKTGTFDNYSWQNKEKTAGLLGSYGNLESKLDKAINEAGKTYGTFSRGAYKKARNRLAFANEAWEKLIDMGDLAELGEIKGSQMASVNTGRYALDIQGGLNQIQRGQLGIKIEPINYIQNLRNRVRAVSSKPRVRPLSELIDYAMELNPRFIQRLNEPEIRVIQSPDGKGVSSHILGYFTDDRGAVVFPQVQEDENGNLFYIDDWRKAADRAEQMGDILIMSPEEAKLFTEKYKTYKPWSDKINEAVEGSQYNVVEENPVFIRHYNGYKNGGVIKHQEGGMVINSPQDAKIVYTKDPYPYYEDGIIYLPGEYKGTPNEFLVHERFHALPSKKVMEQLKDYWENLSDERLKKLGADISFIKQNPDRYYLPEELVGRIAAAKYMSKGQQYSPEFFINLKDTDENKYGDNMRDLLHMYSPEVLSFIFNVPVDEYYRDLKSPKRYKKGGSLKKIKIPLKGKDFIEGEYIEVDSIDEDQKQGRKPIGKDRKGRDIFLNGDGVGVVNQNGRLTSFKEGGAINSSDYDFMTGSLSFKKGGSLNVIPEGALHARKHHMENSKELTLKGIPVVDTEGKQLAEIECNEIIFRKEVTDKIEKLKKEFEDASNSKKDEIAIQCGRMLTKEIMNNTEDRTGLIKLMLET